MPPSALARSTAALSELSEVRRCEDANCEYAKRNDGGRDDRGLYYALHLSSAETDRPKFVHGTKSDESY